MPEDGSDRREPSAILLRGIDALGAALGKLPVERRLALGAGLARLGGFALRQRRDVALRNLRIAFPDWDEEDRRQVFQRSCAHLGRGVIELLTFGQESKQGLLARVEVEGFDEFERARRKSPTGGLIALTAHLGNWEILAGLMRAHDLEIAVVKRGRDSRLVEAGLTRLREEWGVELLTRGSAARGALRAIRNGKILAVPLDQNCSRNEGVFSPFFGRLACTRDGPIRIAMRTGAPVLPCFIERIGHSDRHRVHIEAPLELVSEGEDREAALLENVGRANAAIETAIRRTPDQWIWMHRRWHTQPEGEARPYRSRRPSQRAPVKTV